MRVTVSPGPVQYHRTRKPPPLIAKIFTKFQGGEIVIVGHHGVSIVRSFVLPLRTVCLKKLVLASAGFINILMMGFL